jgi:hypothetical protein
MSLLSRKRPVVLLTLLALALAGCSSYSGRRQVYPVQGQLFIQGQPADGARVVFYLSPGTGSDPQKPVFPLGDVAADGSFQLTTYLKNDGAPEGEYAVTVVWPEPRKPGERPDSTEERPDRLNGRYAEPENSPFHATIIRGTNTLAPFHLD